MNTNLMFKFYQQHLEFTIGASKDSSGHWLVRGNVQNNGGVILLTPIGYGDELLRWNYFNGTNDNDCAFITILKLRDDWE